MYQLPEALQAKGIVFIGPDAAPMHALGDKIGATIIAQVCRCRPIDVQSLEFCVYFHRVGAVGSVIVCGGGHAWSVWGARPAVVTRCRRGYA